MIHDAAAIDAAIYTEVYINNYEYTPKAKYYGKSNISDI